MWLLLLAVTMALAAATSATARAGHAGILSQSSKVGARYQSWLSPWQEGDDETNAPKNGPKAFQSTLPPRTRAQIAAQGAKGYGIISVLNDFSSATVEVELAGIKASDIVMFHIHCGAPGVLGPILVDFGLIKPTFVEQFSADNKFKATITDQLIMDTAAEGDVKTGNATLDKIYYVTMGCFIQEPTIGGQDSGLTVDVANRTITLPLVKESTVAGLAHIGNQGDLYFNVHTKYANYYGALRGQLVRM